MVEGKVSESFGPTLGDWRTDASPGKDKRLDFLLEKLCISAPIDGTIRYQLLHRAASAIITAEQYHAVAAIVLIHSFSEDRAGRVDYEAFLNLFGLQAESDVVQGLKSVSPIPLFAMWITGDCRFLKS